MPHLTIQMTPNVSIAHEESLLKALNKALWDSGHFGKPTDIKARIVPIETFLVGVEDDEQVYGFIYAHLKLITGRDMVIRNQLAGLLVTTIEQAIGAEQSGRAALQICVEVEEISAVYHKKMLGS
ncbi:MULTISPECIES: 5-carboxymethyl-2-hydroxymuconate Delta-isomerase [unclassified Psychrobacter]|uniref:5-carboxymethyl-2-hydroxymuconate Delta-isomerase n=1 Tax=unclassified Psychrobacter TaxID=196806 RepID=UPI000ECA8A0B|nr:MULTISPECIES: 5-carboxymethyl-2-hydroxymuconate Delta-isomerase [unclassified Psychrobacter]MBE8608127.1 5-carboxymethyl-2-hydroxymuconate Delta-isomerase [Pseudomonas lundensis]HCI75981.1 5-carboxymethyl-2-hydroxymuconate isomerase [Psychrobacter sp.]